MISTLGGVGGLLTSKYAVKMRSFQLLLWLCGQCPAHLSLLRTLVSKHNVSNTPSDRSPSIWEKHFPTFRRLFLFLFGWAIASSPARPQSPPVDKESLPAEGSSSAEGSLPAEGSTPVEEPASTQSLWARMQQGLAKTSSGFAQGIGSLLLGKKAIDESLLEDIESQLLMADVGLEATNDIIESLTEKTERNVLKDSEALYVALKQALTDMLLPVEKALELPEPGPAVILVVGVNGVGKTTTIGKMARRFQQQGKSVMLAAGDTFRAAAVEQLQVWGERNGVPVVAQHTGADSASVIHDAVSSAKAKQVDVVIADTAGRLHTKGNLMEELAKVKRVIARLDPSAPHEVLLVLDAGTGQNALNQAQQFVEAAGVTGIALTKLDGTAKGGIIFALSRRFGLPVRFIGVGEKAEDLQPFDARRFVKALFNDTDPS